MSKYFKRFGQLSLCISPLGRLSPVDRCCCWSAALGLFSTKRGMLSNWWVGGWLLHTVGCGTLAAVSHQILLDPHVLGVWNIVVGWPIFKSPGRIIYLLAEGVISPLQSASLLLLLCLFPFLVSLCPLPFPSQLLAFLSLLFSVLFPLFAAPHHVHPLHYLLKVEEPTRAPLLLLLLPAIIWGNKDLRSAQMLLVDLTLTRKGSQVLYFIVIPILNQLQAIIRGTCMHKIHYCILTVIFSLAVPVDWHKSKCTH